MATGQAWGLGLLGGGQGQASPLHDVTGLRGLMSFFMAVIRSMALAVAGSADDLTALQHAVQPVIKNLRRPERVAVSWRMRRASRETTG